MESINQVRSYRLKAIKSSAKNSIRAASSNFWIQGQSTWPPGHLASRTHILYCHLVDQATIISSLPITHTHHSTSTDLEVGGGWRPNQEAQFWVCSWPEYHRSYSLRHPVAAIPASLPSQVSLPRIMTANTDTNHSDILTDPTADQSKYCLDIWTIIIFTLQFRFTLIWYLCVLYVFCPFFHQKISSRLKRKLSHFIFFKCCVVLPIIYPLCFVYSSK